MRFVTASFSIDNSSTTQTAAVDASELTGVSVQAKFSDGAAAGSLKLQASNDPPGASAPANWNDIPNTSQSVSSGALTLIPLTSVCYRWVRVVFASSGGAGTIAIELQGQGF